MLVYFLFFTRDTIFLWTIYWVCGVACLFGSMLMFCAFWCYISRGVVGRWFCFFCSGFSFPFDGCIVLFFSFGDLVLGFFFSFTFFSSFLG